MHFWLPEASQDKQHQGRLRSVFGAVYLVEFIQERFHCKAPSCGGCGSCNLPDGVPAAEYFADYIEGKVEFVKLAAKIWE